jgi:hypothetical protein
MISIMTDAPELEQYFLDEKNAKIISESIRYFKVLHVADDPVPELTASLAAYNGYLPVSRRMLRLEFVLPPASEMNKLEKLMSLMGTFIDLAATVRLSPMALKKTVEMRRKVKEMDEKKLYQQKLEEFRKKKADEKAEKLKAGNEDVIKSKKPKIKMMR